MRYRSIAAVVLATLLLVGCFLPATAADKTYQYCYTYHNGELVESLPAFDLRKVIDQNDLQKNASIVDVETGEDTVYLVDEANSRIYLLDRENYSLVHTISKTILDKNGKPVIVDEESGKQLTMNGPKSVFLYDQQNELYVADTGNERILVLDADGLYFKRAITRPENMIGDTQFAPNKLVVTPIGKIYFTVTGSTEGIVELNNDGSFSCYFGTNEPEVSVIDYIWKSLASDAIREQMSRTYAPEFSSIDMDAEGFLYAVSFDAESTEKIFRFNGKGANVIRAAGNAELTGDAVTGLAHSTTTSQFVDIAVSDYGLYAVLDKTYGRVFVYNFDGYLLNVFSSRGSAKGQLRTPAGITWCGDDLLLVDSELAVAYVYTPTDFGSVMLEAEEKYYHGEWAAADDSYRQALKLNANYYVAYSGIGRNCLMNGKYEDAMYYFEMADDKNGYSQAYEEYRAAFIKENYVWFFLVILLAVVAVVYSEVRYQMKKKKR